MKVINNENKIVINITYYGLELQVPNRANYVAVDENGDVMWYENKPFSDEYEGIWITNEGQSGDVCRVDLEGENWMNTLVEV